MVTFSADNAKYLNIKSVLKKCVAWQTHFGAVRGIRQYICNATTQKKRNLSQVLDVQTIYSDGF